MPFNPEIVWGMWLLLFLVYEVGAAISSRRGDTLSENVGDWVGVPKWRRRERRFSRFRRLILFGFMVALTLHLVWGVTVGPVVVLGALLGFVIAWGIFREK